MGSLGKLLIVTGIVLVVFGAVLTLGGKLSWFGRLPGDVYIQRKNFSFYFPITTSILIRLRNQRFVDSVLRRMSHLTDRRITRRTLSSLISPIQEGGYIQASRACPWGSISIALSLIALLIRRR